MVFVLHFINLILYSLYIYIGYIIFGIIFYIFKNLNKEDEVYGKKNIILKKFVYDKYLKKTEKDKIKNIILVSLAFVFHIEIKKVFLYKDFNFLIIGLLKLFLCFFL